MLPDQLKKFRDIVTLKDGVNVLLRPMTPEDEEQLLGLFSPISEEDLRYLRDNVKDPQVVRSWCQNLDYSRVLPLLALVKDRVVGQASLHFRSGPKRHLGEVRIFLAKDFRRRGLGSRMLSTLIELARRQGLHTLVAEIVADQSKVVKAFQNLGFVLRCTFEDYFMLPDGDTRDVAILLHCLRPKVDEF
ncbi:MAG TPA: GNAT family N-acetyltransferase [Anaerolineales bacterium]|nr:GNAT family N-acetyltransferase [Anaerolineales bacterium]